MSPTSAPRLALAPTPDRLASLIDELAGLRATIREHETAERAATKELLMALDTLGVATLSSLRHTATLGVRVTLAPDPELFLHATGPAGYPALRVSTEKARELLDGGTLSAISTETRTPVLTVRAR